MQVALFMHDYKYDRLPPSYADIFQKSTFLHARHAKKIWTKNTVHFKSTQT